MNNLIDTLAASTLAVVVAGAVPNLAVASEKEPLNPVQLGRTGGLIVFAEKETEPQHPAKINVMLRGYDPVAYFEQGKAVRGKRSIWSTYNGVTYFFASTADKTKFDQNPKKFEPQYGGFCARSMANGRKVKSDPTLFSIHQGKLYVHSTPALKSQFTSDPATHISRADNNWLKLGPATYNSEEHSFDEPWPFGPEGGAQ
jgi:YHS domain-containing protein